jgi:hypothetical protein
MRKSAFKRRPSLADAVAETPPITPVSEKQRVLILMAAGCNLGTAASNPREIPDHLNPQLQALHARRGGTKEPCGA